MKPILTTLLLLLCLSGRGQIHFSDSSISSESSLYARVYKQQTDSAVEPWTSKLGTRVCSLFLKEGDKEYHVLSVEEWLMLYDDYERECWNDTSLLVDKYIFEQLSDLRESYGIIGDDGHVLLLRKNPSLKDFIDFIRKKYSF